MPATDALCLTDAVRMKEQLINILRPHVARIASAGSIRRNEAVVGDIELVAEPTMVPLPQLRNLFDTEPPSYISALDRFAAALPAKGDLILDPVLKRNGPRYKRLLYLQTIAVDLFIVQPPAQWGALLAIRTGDRDFSHLLVTKRSQGGAMPDELTQREGALWHGTRLIQTPSEEEYFTALGLPEWPPSQRSGERLRAWLRSTVAR